jgi:hypothetical protein
MLIHCLRYCNLSQLLLNRLKGSRIWWWVLFGVVHSTVFLLEVRSMCYSFFNRSIFCNLDDCVCYYPKSFCHSTRYFLSSLFNIYHHLFSFDWTFLLLCASAFVPSIAMIHNQSTPASLRKETKSLNSFLINGFCFHKSGYTMVVGYDGA